MSPIQFVEDTVSGREKWESRGIGRLLKETAQPGDVVIFSEVSRMARSTLQVLEMLECCVRREINVHIAKQGMVLDGSMQSQIRATVLGLAAEIERELIVLRTTEALAKRKAEGKTLGRPLQIVKVAIYLPYKQYVYWKKKESAPQMVMLRHQWGY